MADPPTQAPLPFEGPTLPEGPPPTRDTELWSWTDLVVFLGFAVFAFFVASILIALGLATIWSVAGWGIIPARVQNSPLVSMTVELVFYVMITAFVYILVVVYHGCPFWSSLNWRRPTKLQYLGYTAGGFVMAFAAQLALALVRDNQDFPLEKMISTPFAAYALGIFAVSVAPLMEELIFRGVIFAVLEKRGNAVLAVVTTAALFGALHVPEYRGAWTHIAVIFLVGTIFSLTRALTRSITPGIILHFAYNFSTLAGLFFTTEHFHHLGTL